MLLDNLSELEKLNKSLDEVLINVFNEIEEYFQIRCKLDISLSDGFIHMAKTRCITGVNSVSRLQYNLLDESKAKFKVEVIRDETVKGELSNHEDLIKKAAVVFKLKDTEIEDIEYKIKENFNFKDDDKISSNLKKRKNIQKIENKLEQIEKETIETDLNNKESLNPTSPTPPTCNQPLNWFGILVPGSLRQAQQAFITATTLTVHLAQCQVNVLNLMHQYRTLKGLKVKIEGDDK